ncbi:MAG: PAS domain-containing protein, partial [Geobacteraceae bacterium]|nr:PAS domain-containing protein [Geobacteraceae bacterium]
MNMERYKVLLVEDNTMDQIAFAHVIRNSGLPYDYKITSSVAEAKKMMDEIAFDIVISDFNLGDGTALDVINDAKDLPVIITTGSGDEETAVNAMKHGACDYLIKDDKHNYLKILPVTVEHAITYKKTARLTKVLTQTIMGVSDSVCITDMNDQIIFANDAFCKMYGCINGSQIIGKNCSTISQEVGIKTAKSLYADIQSADDEHYFMRKDGTTLVVSSSETVINDEKQLEIAVARVSRDITAKK